MRQRSGKRVSEVLTDKRFQEGSNRVSGNRGGWQGFAVTGQGLVVPPAPGDGNKRVQKRVKE